MCIIFLGNRKWKNTIDDLVVFKLSKTNFQSVIVRLCCVAHDWEKFWLRGNPFQDWSLLWSRGLWWQKAMSWVSDWRQTSGLPKHLNPPPSKAMWRNIIWATGIFVQEMLFVSAVDLNLKTVFNMRRVGLVKGTSRLTHFGSSGLQVY